jgi:autotransporter-associated beta strand protein
LVFGSANTNTTFSGTITGSANFTKRGTGTLTWNGSGTNTYSGNTSIEGGGKITLGSANRIPDGILWHGKRSCCNQQLIHTGHADHKSTGRGLWTTYRFNYRETEPGCVGRR